MGDYGHTTRKKNERENVEINRYMHQTKEKGRDQEKYERHEQKENTTFVLSDFGIVGLNGATRMTWSLPANLEPFN